MPVCKSLLPQAADDWRIDVFRTRLDVPRAPNRNAAHSVLSRALEVAQKGERGGETVAGPAHYRSVILLLRQRVNSFGDLHCRSQFVPVEGIAPLTYECHVKEERTAERATQGLGSPVTNSGFWGYYFSRCQVCCRLQENEEPIFRREALPFDARFNERSPASVFKEMN